MNEFERRSRADRLNAVREDLDGVLTELDAEYIRHWRTADTTDKREDAHRYVSLIQKFRGALNAVALDGKAASDAIALDERRRGWGILGRRTG